MLDKVKMWDGTCRVLLGQEIGDISLYSAYLKKFLPTVEKKKSVLSGKGVAISDNYKNARFISGEEAEEYRKVMGKEKLDINKIKDFDSIIESLQEKICYAGNIHLGKFSEIENSNRLIDAIAVHDSDSVFYSKYIGYSHLVRYSEHIFGSMCISKTRFGIRNFETYEDTRLMETVRTYHSSDCYYTANLECCHNCMFSFNLRNKGNCIGNVQLAFDRYTSLKTKLIEDIVTNLRSKKQLPSIVEIVGDRLWAI